MNIHLGLVVQHDVSIQVDKPVACSSPVKSGTPLMADDSITSFADDMYVQSVSIVLYYTKLCSMQEEYLPTDTTVEDDEEVDEKDKSVETIQKDNKYNVFESCLLRG